MNILLTAAVGRGKCRGNSRMMVLPLKSQSSRGLSLKISTKYCLGTINEKEGQHQNLPELNSSKHTPVLAFHMLKPKFLCGI